jgi:hypothetical protein
MQQMQSVPASQQIQQITQKLTQALVEKADAEAKVKESEQTIIALRNVLAGIGLGQQLAAETAKPAVVNEPAHDH